MFLVFNREKICTYIVSVLTVILLFCVVTTFQVDERKSTETSSNAEKTKIINNENEKNNEI